MRSHKNLISHIFKAPPPPAATSEGLHPAFGWHTQKITSEILAQWTQRDKENDQVYAVTGLANP